MKGVNYQYWGIVPPLLVAACAVVIATAHADEQQASDDNVEHIEVLGRRFIPEHQGSDGAFTLNRQFLDSLLKGNGNISDLLTILPGVQGSENASQAEKQAEIRSQLISISGAQPWQTAFMLDGLNNSSRIDPASAERATNSVNDVQGHPEGMFINQSLVGSVTVYDSNVPARYGNFVGGVVDVEMRQPYQVPKVSLGYRRAHSSWNSYKLIDNLDYSESSKPSERTVPESPVFDKETVTVSTRVNPTKHQSLVLSAARTTSTITEVSLGESAYTSRESVSTSLRWGLQNVGVDSLVLGASYAPYKGDHLLTNVKDSAFTQEGGGYRVHAQVEHQLGDWSTNTRLSWSFNENSRTAPHEFYTWWRAPGKDWGLNVGKVPLSSEGGYGSIKKEHESMTLRTDVSTYLGRWLNSYHTFDMGFSVEQSNIQRTRPNASVIYSSAYRDAGIRCGDATRDCIEQSYTIPLHELAAQLGGTIDFTNPEHLAAYQENILTRGQFFQYRRIYPQELIDVDLFSAGLYAEVNSKWQNTTLNTGIRIDYDDFLENVNTAFRLRGDHSLSAKTRLFAGYNRYYAANLTTYAIREAQRPYVTQYRPIQAGQVGAWLTANSADRYRYRFDNVKTPHSDEASFGIRQSLFGGYLSLKGVHRRGSNLITRGPQVRENGYTYLYQENEGRSEHSRLSVSYYREWENHGIMFNTSFTENRSNAASYDDTVEGVPEDELVFLGTKATSGYTYKLMSYDDLTRRQEDFSRPLTANLVLRSDWHERFSSTLTMTYTGVYESAQSTGVMREVERGDEVCADCGELNLSYPVFIQSKRPARWLFNSSLNYSMPTQGLGTWQVSLEISNLLDSRTHTIGPNQIGWETGRSFWAGIQFQW